MAARFYRALESVSIASAFYSALPMSDPSPSTPTVLNSQLLTARKKEWWTATAEVYPEHSLFFFNIG